MSSQALYNRWRSQTFDDVLGQDHITTTLKNQIRAGRIGHAYLFTGLRGTGKTSMARIMAKAVNCTGETDNPPCNVCHMCTTIGSGRSLDLMEIDAASNRGIDEIRELRERVSFVPHEARYKVYVIDEVHMLTKEASNALLKTLEEPPAHVIFILCTTEPYRLLDTILSRCQRFDFRRASVPVLLAKLHQICEGEGIAVEEAALEYIARRAAGSFRDAESLLEHVAAHASGQVHLETVRHLLGAVPSELITELITAMLTGDAARGLRLVNEALDQGADPRQFIGEVLAQLRGLMLLSVGGDDGLQSLGPETISALQLLVRAKGFSAQFLVQAIRSFTDAAQSLRNAVHTQLPLELAVVETILAADRSGVREPAAPEPELVTPPDEVSRRAAGAARVPPRGASVAPGEVSPREGTVRDATHVPGAEEQDESRAAHSAETVPVEAASDPGAEQSPASAAGNSAVVPESAGTPGAEVPAEPQGEAPFPAQPITLEWAQGMWNQIIQRMGTIDRGLQAILRSAYPIRIAGDVVTLGCESSFHRDRLSETKRMVIVERVMSDVLEAPCRIQCVVEKNLPTRTKGEPSPDEHLFSGVDRRAEREKQLRNHPAVKVLEQRGGQVTSIDLVDDDTE